MAEGLDVSGIATLERLSTSVPGLDEILHGGFFKGSVYMVRGEPGTGKTILGNQLCFHHALAGGTALYVTLLAESHHRMLAHLRDLGFFNAAQVSRSIHYISAFTVLEAEGLQGVLNLLRREIVARRATMLVLDGHVGAGEATANGIELKKFFHALQMQASLTDCTMFLLSSQRTPLASAEQTMVDGCIVLADDIEGWLARRSLTVTKLRGSPFARGQHSFAIDQSGITVFPRIESVLTGLDAVNRAVVNREPTGVAGLDRMLGGGLPDASCTLVMGPVGIGKTTLGLQFLGALDPKEGGGLHYGFYEPPTALLNKADGLELPLRALVDAGILRLSWEPGVERLLDDVGHEILRTIEQYKVRRLVVDGLAAFNRLSGRTNRMSSFFAALTNEFRARGISALFTFEAGNLSKFLSDEIGSHLTQFADNLITLRYDENRGDIQRLISIMKVRNGDFDHEFRRYVIADGGIRVYDPTEMLNVDLEGTGSGNQEPGTDAPSRSRRNRGR